MKTYKTIVIVVLLVAVNVQATTIRREFSKEIFCECINVYTRLSFEITGGLLSNIEVINSSSNDTCDEWNIRNLTYDLTANHSDDIRRIAVYGYTAKDKTMNYELCLKTEEVEFDPYWVVEDVSIDLENVNDREH